MNSTIKWHKACQLEQLDENIKGGTILGLQNLNGFSLAIDESGDINGVAQLGMYVCYIHIDGKCIWDELLNLVPLARNTHIQDVYDALVNLFQELNIDIKLMKSIASDSWSSMVNVCCKIIVVDLSYLYFC